MSNHQTSSTSLIEPMLPIHVDMALPTKEDQHALCQLILLNGFQTDPNRPGVENCWMCCPIPMALHPRIEDYQCRSVGAHTCITGKLFLVKGWNRCLCALGILYCCYDTGLLLQEGLPYNTNKPRLLIICWLSDVHWCPWEELPRKWRRTMDQIG